jgi:DNA-binding response OmpR family regulator
MNEGGRTIKRILVADNDASIGDMCQRVLTRGGFEVEIAADEKSTQDMIDRNHYDICLIDIQRPAIDGLRVYQWLQKSHSEAANGVIFTTADLIDDEIIAFVQDSGALFLPKPFTPDELTAAVEESLKRLEG